MIYQETNEHGSHFGTFSHKAEYEGHVIYGKSITDIEDIIKRDYENSTMVRQFSSDEKDAPPLIMPTIESCTLTSEQQARFDEICIIPDITLDDVVGYTFENKQGTSVAYKLYNQKHETILQGQMITDLEINEIANAQTLTELELLVLGGK